MCAMLCVSVCERAGKGKSEDIERSVVFTFFDDGALSKLFGDSGGSACQLILGMFCPDVSQRMI